MDEWKVIIMYKKFNHGSTHFGVNIEQNKQTNLGGWNDLQIKVWGPIGAINIQSYEELQQLSDTIKDALDKRDRDVPREGK
jgi:hypothetical protein